MHQVDRKDKLSNFLENYGETCDPYEGGRMPRPYSCDLRNRVVEAYQSQNVTQAEIGMQFQVGEATVGRWWRLFCVQGNTEPQAMGGDRRSIILTDDMEELVEVLLKDDAAWSLQELSEELEEEFEVKLSPPILSRELKKRKYSFKRGSFVRAPDEKRRL